jgi:hypothetical protein
MTPVCGPPAPAFSNRSTVLSAAADERVSMAFRLLNSYMQRGNDVRKLDFCQHVVVTPRVLAASRVVLPLLRRLFETVLDNASCGLALRDLLVAALRRFEPSQLYSQLPAYQSDVKKEVLAQMLAMFKKQPSMLTAPDVRLLALSPAFSHQ